MAQILERVRRLGDKAEKLKEDINGLGIKAQKRREATITWRTETKINLKFVLKLMWIILGTLLTSVAGIVIKFIYDFMNGG